MAGGFRTKRESNVWLRMIRIQKVAWGLVWVLGTVVASAQPGSGTQAATSSQTKGTQPTANGHGDPQPDPAEPPPGAHGAVLFSRGSDTPADEVKQAGALSSLQPGDADPLHVTPEERTAETFTRYGLELHLTPAEHGVVAIADLGVRNDGATPMSRVVLQVSSSLKWYEIVVRAQGSPIQRAHWTARRVATDADHTGWVSEAVVPLAHPVAPGGEVQLRVSYSGTIAQSAERLERIGAPPGEAAAADWDAIDASGPDSPGTSVALRGFGNVLWYPVSAEPVFLGDGAKLVEAAGKLRLRQQHARMALRLLVEFGGDPPDAAFFCGRPATFKVLHDEPDMPVAMGTGVAIAEFSEAPLGFRVPSLFVTDHPSTAAGTDSNPDLIAGVTENFEALNVYGVAGGLVEPLMTDWLGPHPMRPLHLLDHPGQPFEDDAVLVRPLGMQTAEELAPSLAHSLTHIWMHSEWPWINEGLAEFMELLWTERTNGRAQALGELEGAARTISLAEPAPQASIAQETSAGAGNAHSAAESTPATAGIAAADAGQPLVRAWSDVFYREKAAAVWWMLRDILGDDALKRGLAAYKVEPALDQTPEGMEQALERAGKQDLRWFFADWVYRDRGLPDLSIVNVIPRSIASADRPGGGWLVAIEVRNDGDAVADVPVTVRSAPGATGASAASETQRLRIPAHTTVTRRIVFPVNPAEVQVNDGSVPETRVSVHREELNPTSTQ